MLLAIIILKVITIQTRTEVDLGSDYLNIWAKHTMKVSFRNVLFRGQKAVCICLSTTVTPQFPGSNNTCMKVIDICYFLILAIAFRMSSSGFIGSSTLDHEARSLSQD